MFSSFLKKGGCDADITFVDGLRSVEIILLGNRNYTMSLDPFMQKNMMSMMPKDTSH